MCCSRQQAWKYLIHSSEEIPGKQVAQWIYRANLCLCFIFHRLGHSRVSVAFAALLSLVTRVCQLEPFHTGLKLIIAQKTSWNTRWYVFVTGLANVLNNLWLNNHWVNACFCASFSRGCMQLLADLQASHSPKLERWKQSWRSCLRCLSPVSLWFHWLGLYGAKCCNLERTC